MLLLQAVVLTALIVWALLMLAVIIAALWPFTVPPPTELDYQGGPWDPDTWPLRAASFEERQADAKVP